MLICSDVRREVLAEDVDEAVAQLVDVELRGVEHDVRAALQLLEQRPLLLDPLVDPVGDRERVAAPGRLESADQRIVGRIEEEHPGAGTAGPEVVDRGLEVAR